MTIKEKLIDFKRKRLEESAVSIDILVDKVFNDIIISIKDQLDISPNMNFFNFNITTYLKDKYLYDKNGKNIINNNSALLIFYLKLKKKFELENFNIIKKYVYKTNIEVFFRIVL